MENRREKPKAKTEKCRNGMGTTKRVTLKDVALHCGVSPMTVSRILNNQKPVAMETAARIRQAIRKLNFTPNLIAKSLRINKTRTFGLVTSDGTYLLYGRLIHNVMETATAAGYSVLIASTNREPDLEARSINMLLDKCIDGLILMAPHTVRHEELERMRDMGIPVVVLMRDGDFPADSIVSDNAGASREIVNHIIRIGSRDITILNLPKEHPNGRERLRGYRHALREHGLPCGREHVFYLTPGVRSGYAFVQELIACGRRSGTFVCGCDSIAVGGIKAALDAGIDVPGDMRFCGFDDIDLMDFLNVPLTTMRQRVEEMGRESVRMLLRRQSPEVFGADPVRLRLPCDLIVRRSTDPEADTIFSFSGKPGLDYAKQ